MCNEEHSKSTDSQQCVCKIVATYLSFNYEIKNQQQSGSEAEGTWNSITSQTLWTASAEIVQQSFRLMRLSVLLLFILISTISNAQRRGVRRFDDSKNSYINTTWKLFELRTRLNEELKTNVANQTIHFTKDSVFIVVDKFTQAGLWEYKNMAFVLRLNNGTTINYEWRFGRENQMCLMSDKDKSKVECYRKVLSSKWFPLTAVAVAQLRARAFCE